jgi:hypothetical protein
MSNAIIKNMTYIQKSYYSCLELNDDRILLKKNSKTKQKKNLRKKKSGELNFFTILKKEEMKNFHKLELTKLNLFFSDVIYIIIQYSSPCLVLKYEDVKAKKTELLINVSLQDNFITKLHNESYMWVGFNIAGIILNNRKFTISVECQFKIDIKNSQTGPFFTLQSIIPSDYSFDGTVYVKGPHPTKNNKFPYIMNQYYGESDFNILPLFETFFNKNNHEILLIHEIHSQNDCKHLDNNTFSLQEYDFTVKNIPDFTLIINIIMMCSNLIYKVINY